MGSRRPSPTTAAARHAAGLFAASGLMAAAAIPLDRSRAASLATVALVDLVLAGLVARLPWHRWGERSTLALVAPASLVIGMATWSGLLPVRSYGVFFVLLFAWIGVHHRPVVALAAAPAVAVAYVAPVVLVDGQPPLQLEGVVLSMGVGILVATTIAKAMASTSAARARAERAAATFATVGRATSELAGMDGDAVLARIVDVVMDLGYDGANLAVLDEASQTFQPCHGRGLAEVFVGARFPLGSGLTGAVARTRAPVVIADYQLSEHGIEAIRASGTRTSIGVPVADGDRVAAVLIAACADVRRIEPEDVEALRIIAVHAAGALAAVARLEAEQERADSNERASRTDPLTSIGNRRRADELLAALRDGDSVALVDVDRFKQVNDHLGHVAGDTLLRELAAFLAADVRAADSVVRYGGEEFLVVLPSTTVSAAAAVLERLRSAWGARAPITTFSAGVAGHRGGDAAATVRRADAALYEAKARGRNRVHADVPVSAIANPLAVSTPAGRS